MKHYRSKLEEKIDIAVLAELARMPNTSLKARTISQRTGLKVQEVSVQSLPILRELGYVDYGPAGIRKSYKITESGLKLLEERSTDISPTKNKFYEKHKGEIHKIINFQISKLDQGLPDYEKISDIIKPHYNGRSSKIIQDLRTAFDNSSYNPPIALEILLESDQRISMLDAAKVKVVKKKVVKVPKVINVYPISYWVPTLTKI